MRHCLSTRCAWCAVSVAVGQEWTQRYHPFRTATVVGFRGADGLYHKELPTTATGLDEVQVAFRYARRGAGGRLTTFNLDRFRHTFVKVEGPRA